MTTIERVRHVDEELKPRSVYISGDILYHGGLLPYEPILASRLNRGLQQSRAFSQIGGDS